MIYLSKYDVYWNIKFKEKILFKIFKAIMRLIKQHCQYFIISIMGLEFHLFLRIKHL
jgi:hypothetical protein